MYQLVEAGTAEQAYRDPSAVKAPHNADSQPYRYCVLFPDSQDYLYADSLVDVLSYLLPHYEEGTEDDKAEARIRLAGRVASVVQANILASLEPGEINEKEWSLAVADKIGPEVVEVRWWTPDVPFLAVQTSYTPYTNVPLPASARSEGVAEDSTIWWIRPAGEDEFVTSLSEVGFIRILNNVDAY